MVEEQDDNIKLLKWAIHFSYQPFFESYWNAVKKNIYAQCLSQ